MPVVGTRLSYTPTKVIAGTIDWIVAAITERKIEVPERAHDQFSSPIHIHIGTKGQAIVTFSQLLENVLIDKEIITEQKLVSAFSKHMRVNYVSLDKDFDADVVRLQPDDETLRLPHVGWNELYQTKPSPLFEDIEDETLFYYVHSYQLVPRTDDMAIGMCDYGGRFVSAVQKDNIFAVQFHPEKSQLGGLALIKNFLKMEG